MIEVKLIQTFPREIIAIDEVGRSPLSGPVVIGALRVVIPDAASLISLTRSLRRCGVKDSKLLSADARLGILRHLNIPPRRFRERGTFYWKNLEVSYLTWEMDHLVIDQENIFQASMRGMKEAALALQNGDRTLTTVLIDGNARLRWGNEASPWSEVPVVKGDVKSPLIGLAAIIAKEKRDQFMKDMHYLYPDYFFDSNAGYPTPAHRRAIRKHGPCEIHRKSFGKVKEYLTRTKKVG